MGLLQIASAQSIWRGIDYYENKKVVSWEHKGQGLYTGIVSGSNDNTYTVSLDTAHPKKSVCNCAFADGRRVICKHMVALYFTAEPWALTDFLKQVEQWEAEEEEQEKQHYEDLKKYVKSLTKAELQERLLEALVQLENRNHYW